MEKLISLVSFSHIMDVGEHIHWFLGNQCNLACSYCFSPDDLPEPSLESVEAIAKTLAENKVKMVTIGGKEPTLAKTLYTVLEILKQSGIYVSLHTNAMTLNDSSIETLSELVDDIAIPIDSHDKSTQEFLRGRGFSATFDRIQELGQKIKTAGLRLGYHTVFTDVNHNHMPQILSLIDATDFDYWRIYQLRGYLAIASTFSAGNPNHDQSKNIQRIQNIEILRGSGTPELGYTDCLFAKFLLAEEQMQPLDERIRFVATHHSQTPYAFITNQGDVSYFAWFSDNQRPQLGNIFTDGYQQVIARLNEVHERGFTFDEQAEKDWIETTFDSPIWARLEVGAYFTEEIEAINPEHIPRVLHLAELLETREKDPGHTP